MLSMKYLQRCRWSSFLWLAILASCGGGVGQDPAISTALVGDTRQDNNYTRFGDGAPAEKFRWIVLRGVRGGLLTPPLYLDRYRYAMLTDRGALVIAEGDDVLHQFNFPNGEHPYPAIIADSSGTLYFITTRGILHAVGGDGVERWSKNLRPADSNAIVGFSHPLGMADGVIAGATTGRLTRFGNDGSQRWSVEFGAGIGPLLCQVNGQLTVALTHNDYSQSDSLITIDAATGARQMVAALPGMRVVAGPAAIGSVTLVGVARRADDGSRQPSLLAVANGKVLWNRPLRLMPRGISGDGEGNIYISGTGTTEEFTGGMLVSFDSAGNQRWEKLFESELTSAAAVSGSYLYVVSRREGRTGLFTYTHEGQFAAFAPVINLPDVSSRITISPIAEPLLVAADTCVVLRGGD